MTSATRTPQSPCVQKCTRRSERLGHSSVSFTLDVYRHAVPALDADAADTIAHLLGDESDDSDDHDQDDDGTAGASAVTGRGPDAPAGGAHARPDSSAQS
jgi:hypothetical protein